MVEATFSEFKANNPDKNLTIVSMFVVSGGNMVVATADEIFIINEGKISPMILNVDVDAFESCSAWC